jgi:hypothetical protein
VPFTSFGAVQPNQRVVMPGISQTASGTATGSGTVATINLSAVDSAASSARLTYDGSRNLSAMSFAAPGSSASYSGGEINCGSGVGCTGENANSVALAADPNAFGWNYQSYGVWFKDTGPTTFEVGAMSAGAVTPGSSVPLSGPGNFTGLSSGLYVDPSGVPFFTSAQVSAVVNWGGRSIAFSTSNSTVANLSTNGTPSSNNDLNMTGTLTYGSGSSQFTGAVNATGAGLSGNATGRFYGPAAEEMGGVYGLTGSGPSRMTGAFGARR